MSNSGKCKDNLNFPAHHGPAEKNQPKVYLGAAEKNKEKVKAYCTGFSAEFFGSQSVEMFSFAGKQKFKC